MKNAKFPKPVLDVLNQALKGELTAINQYFLHSRMLEDWGVTKLAEFEYKESIDEMKHADMLVKRILLIGGLPNLQDLGKLYIGQDVKEVLECDLRLEKEGIAGYRNAIKVCEEHGDFVSSQLLKTILTEEEGHEDFMETSLDMIETIGLANFIQLNTEGGGHEH
jgi:bacterioferritin